MILYVRILGVGVGADSTIGMYNGDLLWSSAPASEYGASTYSHGFIDQSSVSGVSLVCNIAEGGALGGFDGDISINAFGSLLVAAISNRSIDLVGKIVEVLCSPFGEFENAVIRYKGTVSSWAALDSVSVEIVSQAMGELDKKKLKTITVTKEMALGIENNSAIGKTISHTFGGRCDFPLVYVENKDQALSMPSGFGYIDDSRSTLDMSPQYLDLDGVLRGKDLFQVLGTNQETVESPVYICLSYNGEQLFTTDASAHVDDIAAAFNGNRLRVVRGNGEGTIVTIINTVYGTKDAGDNNITTIWFETDIYDANKLVGAGGYSEYSSFDESNHQYYVETKFVDVINDTRTTRDRRFSAAYKDGKIRNDVSFVSFIGDSNLFIVDKDADTTKDCTLVGGIDGETTEIPVESIDVVYIGNVWKMIKVSIPNIINDNETEISYELYTSIGGKSLQDSTASSTRPNVLGWMSEGFSIDLVPVYEAPIADTIPDLSNLPFSFAVDTELYEYSTNRSYQFESLVSSRVDSVFNGVNLSSLDKLFFIPSFRFMFRPQYAFLTENHFWTFTLTIDLDLFSSGNLCLGRKTAKIVFKVKGVRGFFGGIYRGGAFISVSPQDGRIYFTGGIYDSQYVGVYNYRSFTYGTTGQERYSYDAFNALKSQLDCSDVYKNLNNQSIRYVNSRIRLDCVADYSDVYNGLEDSDGSKTLYNVYLGYTKKISKDKLYLRTTKEGSSDSNHVDLFETVCTTSGLDVDSTSFSESSTVASSMQTPSYPYNGYINAQPNSLVSDLLNSIATQSVFAFYQGHDGLMYAKYFGDFDTLEAQKQITQYDVIKDSLRVSKPSGGYLYTDFTFSLAKNAFGVADTMSINTDSEISSFPASDYVEEYGDHLTTTDYTFTQSFVNDIGLLCINISSETVEVPRYFIVGGRLRVSFTDLSVFDGTIRSIAPYITADQSRGLTLYVQLDQETSSVRVISSIQRIAPNLLWRDFVSGSIATEYIDSMNLWEHAQSARLALGVERAMSKNQTEVKDPIYGDDSRALRQYVANKVLWATREKTVVRFKVRMTAVTMALKPLTVVLLKASLFMPDGIKGLVVEIADSYADGTIDVTLLCPRPESELMLVLNENYITEQQEYSELGTDNDVTLNEGSLA